MGDYYLEDRTRLNGQPKRTIVDYVEQNGLLVPQRFDSLAEARAAGVPFLARSEHPQDYDGASGIVPTLRDEHLLDITSEEDLKRKALYDKDFSSRHELYCRLLNVDPEQFAREVSFSYWEKLDGFNRTVVADSAIQERYHIMTYRKSNVVNYTLFEGGKIAHTFLQNLPIELVKDLDRLVELYETVRTLPNFASSHCPIMEIQTSNGKNYFLQYHRARDFLPTTFELSRELQQEEHPVEFVRGATPSEGMVCTVTVDYGWWLSGRGQEAIGPQLLHTPEDGSFDSHYFFPFSDLMTRKRKLQITPTRELETKLLELVVGHDTRSKMFKPQVSVIINSELYDTFVPDGDDRKMFHQVRKTGENHQISLYVISDGRTAYLKRVD